METAGIGAGIAPAGWHNPTICARWALTILAVAALFAFGRALPVAAQRPAGPVVQVGHIRGEINLGTARYVERLVDLAERRDVQLLVIQIDTPGGYDTAMRQIVQRMLGANVPVAVFVSPSGARAGSAGVFVTLAADVAVMAPGTAIGAAHPVSAAPGGAAGIGDPVMSEKVTNDAAALARSLAQQRGRNADWAERAVRNSESLAASEALRAHVVDEVASDLDDLLNKLDGRKVTGPWGEKTLRTRGGVIFDEEMNIPEEALHWLVDPNVAYVLFAIGTYAILAELYSPGAVVPAVVGGICLLLGLIAFGSLPVNWGGFALLVLAVGMFLAEIKITSHGFLALGGAVEFALGSLLLFPTSAEGPYGAARLSGWLVAAMVLASVLLFSWILQRGLAARRRPPLALTPQPGDVGVAESWLSPAGTVRVHSEEWSAVARHGTIAAGAPVRVVARHGLALVVEEAT